MRHSEWKINIVFFICIVLVLWSPDWLWRVYDSTQSASVAENEIQILRGENSYLKTQLIEKNSQPLPDFLSFDVIDADVYSRYPVNFKNELILNKGSRDGVSAGSPILITLNHDNNSSSFVYFMGNVSSVLSSRSSIMTIFDHRFKLAVHIGQKKIPGLLIGGLSPTITTIPKDASVASMDVVINADTKAPYGLILGSIKDVRSSPDGLFQESGIELPYDVNNITRVLVGLE